MSKAETAEKAVENINVVAETGKIIDDELIIDDNAKVYDPAK